MSAPFNPGDIVRYGIDNGMYIRGLDGSWFSVNIGYPGNWAPSGYPSGRDDGSIADSIKRGHAQVIYRSPGHYEPTGAIYSKVVPA